MSAPNKDKDDTIYKHFHSDEHHDLRDIELHVIDKVNAKDNLLAKEGQWAYLLQSVRPEGLNESKTGKGEHEEPKRIAFLSKLFTLLQNCHDCLASSPETSCTQTGTETSRQSVGAVTRYSPGKNNSSS
ncbi:hypothetical protein P5673_021780 [Acropora cervicornis]|uniref:Uncharacterized protein n=1 Tax=Acropora cervicornis TaxID=6130 RepID=A0AAD9Q8A6_ACRCE|nr:hypothetical protein P5673_021780 [Acropora cervicornis]